MKKTLLFLSLAIVFALGCKNDDPEPETKKQIIYDTTKVIDRHIDSIFHHFYDTTHVKYTDSIYHHFCDSIYHHFYDTLTVYDTVRVPILCDHSWVIYVHNNSTDDVDSLYIKNGASITLKSDLSRNGFDLVKWSTSPTGSGTNFDIGDNYYVTDDIKLYAIWQRRDGLRSNEVYDFLAKQAEGSTVDVKIIDLNPDFAAISTALKKYWKVNVNLDLEDAIEVTSLEDAFNNCTNLKTINLPPNLQTLGYRVFDGCSGLAKLVIPSNVTSLALSGCSNLSTLIIPESIIELHISECPQLTPITIPNNVKKLGLANLHEWKSLTIPNSVTKLNCVADCPKLTEITIPASVEGMYMNFQGCTNLKTIKHSLKECDGVNFQGCKNLTSITLPVFRPESSVISTMAFSECSSLTSLTIPEGVTSIGWAAFSGCSSLTSITIPESVTSIDDFAFSVCSSLKTITIPDNVTSIGNQTFLKCTSLTSIIIPEGVISIGESAFENCSNLTSVIIPESITNIESDAFFYCTSLTSIKIKASTPPTLKKWITNIEGITISVPSSAVNAYKTADIWKDHAYQIVGY